MPGVLKVEGYKRLELMRLLASGVTCQEIGLRYNVPEDVVLDWYQEHLYLIDQIRADQDNEYAGLWITEKAFRLAEIEYDVEVASHRMKNPDNAQDYARLLKLKQAGIRLATEILGDMPVRAPVPVTQETAPYIYHGVDVDAV
jgi:hypothetical protein